LTLSQALIARHASVAPRTGHRTQAPGRTLSSLPLSAQAPIADALGADQPTYHIQTLPGGFEANNAAQRLTTRFSDAGVQIVSGKTRVGLSLRALGYGRALRTLGAASPKASANRVTYAHGGLRLWYVNGPLGLEQGFSIARAPSGPAGEPLTLVLAVSGHVHASLAGGGGGVTFSHAGGPSLRYSAPRISDAAGRAMSGRLELRGRSVLVYVDTRGARYPLRIDPFIKQTEKLVGNGQAGAATSRFGWSVALSADGNTALIGGRGDYGNTGAAWVFTRSGSTWTQQGSKLTGGGEQGEAQFGSSVALSATGSTALVGGPGDNNGLGAAWVFTRTGSTWTQQGSKLTGGAEVSSPASPGQFGSSVALAGSESSATALIGGQGDNSGLGAAWAFTRSGSTWTQQGSKLTGGEEVSSSEAPGQFGAAVALFATESSASALIGGPGDNKGLGAAWAFTRSGSTWTQQGPKLTGGEEISGTGAAGEFGASVALAAAEGNTGLVGGPGDNKGLGAAWAFTRSGSTWTQQGSKLTGSGEVSGTQFPGEFGSSVALASAEGGTALIGGPGDNSGAGAAWAFTRSGSTWTQQGSKLTGGEEISSTEAPGGFGSGVALASDGNTGLMGGPGDNKSLGAGWAFTRSGSTWTQQGSKLTGSGASARSLGGQGDSVAMSSDGNTALIGGPGDGFGSAWVFTRAGSTWTQQGAKLTGTEEGSETRLGASVALSANGNTALIGGPGDNKGVGAAWAFTRSGSTWSQQGAKLTGSGESGAAHFGSGVALSSDGNTAVIGGPLDSAGAGAVWAFTRASEKWSQQGAKLAGSGATGAADLGFSVALSSDGNTALAGGPHDNGEAGAAWVFTRASETWSQQGGKLTPSGVGGVLPPLFGESVALSSDGNTALIGGPYDEAGSGAAWAFTRSGSTWSQQGTKLTGSGVTGLLATFGLSVALSSDGNTALIGGPLDGGEAGAVWEFRRSGSTWTQEGSKLTAAGAIGSAQFGVAVSLSSLGNIGLIGGPKDYGGTGAAWAFVTPSTETQAASSISQTQATLNATVNPNGGEVSECKFEYGTTTSYGQTAPCSPSSLGQGESPVAVSARVAELTPNTEYDFRIVAKSAGGESKGSNATFKTLANVGTAPTVVTEPASPVASASATLNATVNPNGGEVYECKFEYGTTTSYGSTAPCTPSPGSGSSPVHVAASIAGLAAGTSYHFRIVAVNPGGTSRGSDETFTTLSAPVVVTAAASSITQTSSTLNATVNPGGATVSECKFEYGTTTAYGSTASCSSLPGSGKSPVAVSASVASLTNKTIYHFRISATNAVGTATGADHTFRATAPHVYKNGVLGAEGKKVRTISWGTVKFANTTLGEVECHTVGAGYLENPTGGGSSVGQTQGFDDYECVSSTCTTQGGKGIEVTAEKLPWSTEATEPEEGVFRTKNGNKTKTAAAVFQRVNCIGINNIQFAGESTPKFLNNGLSIGAFPVEAEFDAPGSGELESEALGGSKIAGKLKTVGFAAQELIELKNP
jgi:hypothetical protein